MKAKILPPLTLGLLSAFAFAQAADYTYYGAGNWDNAANWRDGALKKDDAATAPALSDYPASGGDIYWIPTGGAQSLTFNIWADGNNDGVNDYTIKSFTYSTAYDTSAANNPKLVVSQNLTITGDLTRVQGNAGNKKLWIVGNSTLAIDGNVKNGGGAETQIAFGEAGTTLNKLIVGGDISGNSPVFFNVAGGAEVKGLVHITNTSSGGSNVILNYSNAASSRSVRIGGLAGASNVKVFAGNTANNNVAYLTLTGYSSDQEFSGTVTNYANADGKTATNGTLHVIMNSSKTYTQSLKGTNSYTGNTVLTQGKLRLNSATTSIGDIYLGYTTSRDSNDLVTGYTAAAGASTSIIFDGAGASAGKLNWSSGALGMNLDGLAAGDNVLTISSLNLVSANEYLFDFENAIEGNTYTVMTISSPMAVSIDGVNVTTIAQLNEIIAKLKSNYGDDFAYDYTTGKLTFTAGALIPEPATYAAIFGALALAFAAYRRKKN